MVNFTRSITPLSYIRRMVPPLRPLLFPSQPSFMFIRGLLLPPPRAEILYVCTLSSIDRATYLHNVNYLTIRKPLGGSCGVLTYCVSCIVGPCCVCLHI